MMFAAGPSRPVPAVQHVPWVEKYRPKTVEDISHQDEVTRTLKTAIASGQLPHLLFYGPPGTGKTTAALACARQLFGLNFRQTGRVLELNASDERGISVVRNKIKGFAQGAIGQSSSMPSFKLIILDEADSMTADAQSALRRMIESYSKVTRFCFICNYVSRIIEPIASRCAKFRFKPLESKTMSDRLEYICQSENIEKDHTLLSTILDYSNGDMRRAINLLQSGHQLNGPKMTSQTILDIAGMVPVDALTDLWEKIKGTNFNALQCAVDELIAAGYPTTTLLGQLSGDIVKSDTLSDAKKAALSLVLAETDTKLVQGASEYMQLLNTSAKLMRVWHA